LALDQALEIRRATMPAIRRADLTALLVSYYCDHESRSCIVCDAVQILITEMEMTDTQREIRELFDQSLTEPLPSAGQPSIIFKDNTIQVDQIVLNQHVYQSEKKE